LNRGNAYRAKGDTAHAIADYAQAIKLKSDFVEAYYYRGLMYSAQNDYAHAIEIGARGLPTFGGRGIAPLPFFFW
jgi:tetratricopeptide (TPR) repeat protein